MRERERESAKLAYPLCPDGYSLGNLQTAHKYCLSFCKGSHQQAHGHFLGRKSFCIETFGQLNKVFYVPFFFCGKILYIVMNGRTSKERSSRDSLQCLTCIFELFVCGFFLWKELSLFLCLFFNS